MTEPNNPPGFTETESGLVVPEQAVFIREQKTLLKEVFKRVRRLAKELWVADLAIVLVCTKCNAPTQIVGELAPVLICKCRERSVR